MESLVPILTVFVLSILLGFEVIAKVPPILHTPLMSGSNAISGITLIGALASAQAGSGWWVQAIAFAAVVWYVRASRTLSAVPLSAAPCTCRPNVCVATVPSAITMI